MQGEKLMFVSQKNGITFASKYEICERSEYEQRKAVSPFAQAETYVTAEFRGRLKDIYRKNLIPAAIVFFVITAVILAYSIYLGKTAKDENKAYFAAIAVAVPFGIGTTILIKNYFSSGKFLVKLNTADGSDGHIKYEYSFYDDEFCFHDDLAVSIPVRDPVTVVPYSCIRKIVITDEAAVFADKQDIGFYLMKKDLPPQLEARLGELFVNAKLTDRRTSL